MTSEQSIPGSIAARSDTAQWWLPAVAVLETISLLVLVLNLVTANDRGLAAALGPVHGTLYLLAITLTFVQHASTRARALAFIPAVGAPLAAWQVRREQHV